LGDFELKLFPVNENDELTLKSGAFTFDCHEYIPVNTPNLGDMLTEGQSVTVGDGEVSLHVTEIINSESVRVRAQNRGVIQYMKTFNIPTVINEEEIIKNYTDIIKKIKNVDHLYVAISFFNFPLHKRICDIIRQEKLDTKIVLKLEKEIPLDQITQLCQDDGADMILIDRGELGVNMPYYQTGIYQKRVVQIAQKYKKLAIISTQLLESTMNNYIPNRAEISDLTNSVLDGVEGIMLCRETAINPRSAYTLSVAKKIITEVEKYKNGL
jgi:pyruvate kinase